MFDQYKASSQKEWVFVFRPEAVPFTFCGKKVRVDLSTSNLMLTPKGNL
jgi:hypothetical protein